MQKDKGDHFLPAERLGEEWGGEKEGEQEGQGEGNEERTPNKREAQHHTLCNQDVPLKVSTNSQ